jgi:hypothetical protein
MSKYAACSLHSWRKVITDQLVSKGVPRKTANQRVLTRIGLNTMKNLNAMNKIGAARVLVNAAVITLRHG